ncbi:MAG: type-F conjugative transfer system secretin TraK [Bdellovibrionales bacterium]|nr:type-F conjugative transfer system secretin TraK [Bdellovibrionales bacterium]
MRAIKKYLTLTCTMLLVAGSLPPCVFARDVMYDDKSGEVEVFVNPGEPTLVKFSGDVAGGYKRKDSNISLDRNGHDLIVFAHKKITAAGEGFIVRLEDGRSYSIRAKKSSVDAPRDDFVTVIDNRGDIILSREEEEPAHVEKQFGYAPPSKVSGLMREMVLNAEFGKNSIVGYQRSDKYRGEPVLDDGALKATIDSIFIGPSLWGYVIDASNQLDQSIKVNPATFRLDGTRAISLSNWELAPRPMNVEQQIAGKHTTKVFVITKARK